MAVKPPSFCSVDIDLHAIVIVVPVVPSQTSYDHPLQRQRKYDEQYMELQLGRLRLANSKSSHEQQPNVGLNNIELVLTGLQISSAVADPTGQLHDYVPSEFDLLQPILEPVSVHIQIQQKLADVFLVPSPQSLDIPALVVNVVIAHLMMMRLRDSDVALVHAIIGSSCAHILVLRSDPHMYS